MKKLGEGLVEEEYENIEDIFNNDYETKKINEETINELKQIYNFYCEHEDLFYQDENGYIRYYDPNTIPENVKEFLDAKLERFKEAQLYKKYIG